MEIKVNGIVIKTQDYRDNDKLLTILSAERGKIFASLKGVKKANAKLKFAGQPFCFAEYVMVTKGDNHTIISATSLEQFYSIREDINKFYIASIMAELINVILYEGMDSEKIFTLFVIALKNISFGQMDLKIILTKFLLDSFELAGFALQFEECYKCGAVIKNRVYYDFESGAGVCEDCFGGELLEINFSTYEYLGKIKNNEIIEASETVKKNGLKFLNYYIKTRLNEKIKAFDDFLTNF